MKHALLAIIAILMMMLMIGSVFAGYVYPTWGNYQRSSHFTSADTVFDWYSFGQDYNLRWMTAKTAMVNPSPALTFDNWNFKMQFNCLLGLPSWDFDTHYAYNIMKVVGTNGAGQWQGYGVKTITCRSWSYVTPRTVTYIYAVIGGSETLVGTGYYIGFSTPSFTYKIQRIYVSGTYQLQLKVTNDLSGAQMTYNYGTNSYVARPYLDFYTWEYGDQCAYKNVGGAVDFRGTRWSESVYLSNPI